MTAEAKDLPANISSKKTALSDAVAKCRFGQAQGLQDAIRRLEGQMRNQTSGDQAFIDSFQTYGRDIAKYIQFLCIAIRLPRTPEFEDDGIDMCNWLIQFLKKIGKKARLGKSTTPKSMALCFRAENFMFGRQRRVKWAGQG